MLIHVIICVAFLPVIKSQACDSSDDSTQCSEDQICRNNICTDAIPCESGSDCSGTSGTTVCVADYCQSSSCTATGQCVHGQVCSQDSPNRHCVNRYNIRAQENTQVKLNFAQPPIGWSYDEIRWDRKTGSAATSRIAFLHEANDGQPVFFDTFCSGDSPCDTSDKISLNTDTGELTIHRVSVEDEGFYYYNYHIDGGPPDTGNKYEIYLEVYVVPSEQETTIEAGTDVVEPGETVRLVCRVNRIKPVASDVYWTIDGKREDGSVFPALNDDNKTFTQENVHYFKFARSNYMKPVQCTIVPVYGDPVTLRKTLNSPPTGAPTVKSERLERNGTQQVILTCDTTSMYVGSPPCQRYTWTRVEDGEQVIKGENTWQLFIDETKAGNYTCSCENDHGESETSDTAELIFLPGSPPATSSSSSGLIIGIVVGVVVVVIVIIIVVIGIIIKKYGCPIRHSVTKRATTEPPSLQDLGTLQSQPTGHENRATSQVSSHAYERIDEIQINKADDDVDDDYVQPHPIRKPVSHLYDEVAAPSDDDDDKSHHAYYNDQGFINQVKPDYENMTDVAKKTNEKSKQEGKIHDYVNVPNDG